MENKLLEMTKGSRFMGYIAATLAAAAFIGFLSGATHQLFIAAIAATCSIVLFSRKAQTNKR